MAEHFPRLKAIGEAATQGPWRVSADAGLIQTNHVTRDVWNLPRHEGDLTMMAVSRNVYDKLLAVAEVAQTIARIMPTPAGPNGLGARLREALAALREFEEKLP